MAKLIKLSVWAACGLALCLSVAACQRGTDATPTPEASEGPTATASQSASPTPAPTIEAEAAYGPSSCASRPPGNLNERAWSGFGNELSSNFLKWTPDGAHLVFSDTTLIRMVDANGSRLLTIVDANPFKALSGERFPYGFHADMSPDGSRVVYSSCKAQGRGPTGRQLYNYEIATVALDGTDPQTLTNNGYYDHFPAWSPDGRHIAFIANPSSSDPAERLPQDAQLFTMAADGSDVQSLTPSLDTAAFYPPVWSPDGGSLAFLTNERDGGTLQRVLYTVRADGSGLSRIAETAGMPAWSPDSEQLAFVTAEGDEVGVNVASPDGSGLREVARGFGGPLAWSPDGSEILASRAVPATRSSGKTLLVWQGIYAVRPDGGGPRLVNPSYLSDLIDKRDVTHRLAGLTAWSPDGSRIAFYDLDGLLVTTARDGTHLRGLVRSDPDFTRLGEKLNPWHPPSDAPVDPEACSAGSAVPDPGANEGLVQDCEILLSIRDKLAGAAELDWSERRPIANWQGVSVDGSPLRVRGLDLSGMTGTLPPDLGRLTALRRLSVEGKGHEFKVGGLTGAVPPELGTLEELEDLHLPRNYLSGAIPPELGGLDSLRSLHLDENLLAGTIPPELGSLEGLQSMHLDENLLAGAIPPELGGLKSLQSLGLGENLLTGAIPPELGSLTSLESLWLYRNLLDGPIPPELGNLRLLEDLGLQGNDLSGCVPTELPEIWVEESGLKRCGP